MKRKENKNKIEQVKSFLPDSCSAEAFRTLRTNIQFSVSSEDPFVLLVTSSFQGEGKSWNSANIANVFAAQGKKTLLIDADLRRGVQEKKFNVSNENGLTNYLASINFNEKKFIKETGIDNLYIITRGNIPPNPSELLASEKMDELIVMAKKEFDVVIIDAPPVLLVTDALILAPKVDRVILVAAMNDTSRNFVLESKTALEKSNAKISGVVLNKAKFTSGSYYKYGYGKYGRYGEDYSD
jgi:capsular exopolysaccharide synthesis family protein